MWTDEIIEEVRATREKHAAECGFDLDKIVDDLQKQQDDFRDRIVTRTPKEGDTTKDEVAS